MPGKKGKILHNNETAGVLTNTIFRLCSRTALYKFDIIIFFCTLGSKDPEG